MIPSKIGQSITNTINFLDQSGHPMAVTPTVDAPPTWTNDTPSVEKLTVSEDGLSCVALALAAGTDVITLSVMVKGAKFTATIVDNVTDPPPEPQTLTSVAILQSVAA